MSSLGRIVVVGTGRGFDCGRKREAARLNPNLVTSLLLDLSTSLDFTQLPSTILSRLNPSPLYCHSILFHNFYSPPLIRPLILPRLILQPEILFPRFVSPGTQAFAVSWHSTTGPQTRPSPAQSAHGDISLVGSPPSYSHP